MSAAPPMQLFNANEIHEAKDTSAVPARLSQLQLNETSLFGSLVLFSSVLENGQTGDDGIHKAYIKYISIKYSIYYLYSRETPNNRRKHQNQN